MSSFDPFYLYRTPKRKTHKGQILQQKPVHSNPPIIQSEIPRSLSVLKTYNYHIFPQNVSLYPQILAISDSELISNPKPAPSAQTVNYLTYTDIFDLLRMQYPTYLPTIGITADNYSDLIESVTLIVDINDLEVFFSPGRNQSIIAVGFQNNINDWTCNTGSSIGANALQATCFFAPKSTGAQMFCYPRQTSGEVIVNIDNTEDMTSPISFSLEGMEILEYIFASEGSPYTGVIFQGYMTHNNGEGGSSTLYGTVDFQLHITPKSQSLYFFYPAGKLKQANPL